MSKNSNRSNDISKNNSINDNNSNIEINNYKQTNLNNNSDWDLLSDNSFIDEEKSY